MAKTKISEFNSNPALNTDIDSINLAEGCAPSGINDAIRELMSQLKDWQSGTSNDPMVIGSTGSLTLNQGTANGVAYLNGSKVVTSGSALTFDGTTLSLGTGGSIRLPSGYEVGFGATNTTYWIGDSTNNWHRWFTSSSEQMRLTSTGLGIGTSSPSAKLSVKTTGAQVDISTSATDLVFEAIDRTTTSNPIDTKFYTRNGTFQWYNGQYTERMRIDSSGNLGLGVTPSAWGGNFKAIQVGSQAAFSTDSGVTADLVLNAHQSGSNWIYKANGLATLLRQESGVYKFFNSASGTAGNAITFTQAMTLDASGNLGVGTTSPSRRLSVYSTSSIPARFETNTSDTKIEILTTSGTQFIQGSANNLLFGTNNTEAARIDSSGNFLIGTTAAGTTAAGSYFEPSSIGYGRINFVKANTGTTYPVAFYYAGSQIGNIANSTTATSYNTSSDYRLKNVIGAVTGHGERIDALEPIEYEWKVDGSRTRGFLAHKFQEVYAGSVTGTKDAVDEQGNPVYQAMQASTSEVIADLVAEIQSLRKRLADAGL